MPPTERNVMIKRNIVAVVVLLSALGSIAVRSQASSDEPEIMRALDAFLEGWNSRDVTKYAAALHFPHVILEGGTIRTFPDEPQFLAIGAQHWSVVQPEWDHSAWEERRIVQRIGDTVHVAGRWARFDKYGKVLSKADVLYVVLKKNGRWAIFARSGNRAAQGNPIRR
jgi:hypothetical protein